jgi:hypothetical protein
MISLSGAHCIIDDGKEIKYKTTNYIISEFKEKN